MSNEMRGMTPEEMTAAQAYSRAESVVILARAIMLASVTSESLSVGYPGCTEEEAKAARGMNAHLVLASFEAAREFYRLAAETLRAAES